MDYNGDSQFYDKGDVCSHVNKIIANEDGDYIVDCLADINPVCGNGVKETGEECDTLTLSKYKGCTTSCKIVCGFICAEDVAGRSKCTQACGNGVVDREYFEVCDDVTACCGDNCKLASGAECTDPDDTNPCCTDSCKYEDGAVACTSSNGQNAYCVGGSCLSIDPNDFFCTWIGAALDFETCELDSATPCTGIPCPLGGSCVKAEDIFGDSSLGNLESGAICVQDGIRGECGDGACKISFCGNGIVEYPEECDDTSVCCNSECQLIEEADCSDPGNNECCTDFCTHEPTTVTCGGGMGYCSLAHCETSSWCDSKDTYELMLPDCPLTPASPCTVPCKNSESSSCVTDNSQTSVGFVADGSVCDDGAANHGVCVSGVCVDVQTCLARSGIHCKVPMINEGVKKWNGNKCASGAMDVESGTKCKIKAQDGYVCKSPGKCADGTFAADWDSIGCVDTRCTIPVINSGVAAWNEEACASGVTVYNGTTCLITAEEFYECTSPGQCIDGLFTALGTCIDTRCTVPVVEMGVKSWEGDGCGSDATVLNGTTCIITAQTGFRCTSPQSCIEGSFAAAGGCISTNCVVPVITEGVEKWKGSSKCKSGATDVPTGTECKIKASSGYECTSPGLCTDGLFKKSGKCNVIVCSVPNTNSGVASWNNDACLESTVAMGITCNITAKSGYLCLSPGICGNDGEFEYEGGCIEEKTSSSSSFLSMSKTEGGVLLCAVIFVVLIFVGIGIYGYKRIEKATNIEKAGRKLKMKKNGIVNSHTTAFGATESAQNAIGAL